MEFKPGRNILLVNHQVAALLQIGAWRAELRPKPSQVQIKVEGQGADIQVDRVLDDT